MGAVSKQRLKKVRYTWGIWDHLRPAGFAVPLLFGSHMASVCEEHEGHPNYVNQPLVSIFATFLTAFSFAIRVILLKPRADKLHIQSFHTTIVWPTLNIPDFLFSSDSLHHLGRNEQASLLVWIFDPLQVNPGAAYSENTKGLCREPKSHEVVHTLNNVWSRTIVHCL